MNDLSEIFQKKINQLGIARQIDAAMICQAFDRAVGEVFKDKAKGKVKAISYRNNTLKVGVISSAWANEIQLQKPSLLGDEIRVVFFVTDHLE